MLDFIMQLQDYLVIAGVDINYIVSMFLILFFIIIAIYLIDSEA